MKSRNTKYGPKDTGAVLSGQIAKFLDPEQLKPRKLRVSSDQGALEFVFDYFGQEYELLLKWNSEMKSCIENKLLQGIHDGLYADDNEHVKKTVSRCLDLFWPFVAKAGCKEQLQSACKKIDVGNETEAERKSETVKIQLKTVSEGRLKQVPHENVDLAYNRAIPNPCQDAPLLCLENIKIIKSLHPDVDLVRLNGRQACMKKAGGGSLKREVETLAAMPMHPSLPQLIGLVDAGNGRVRRFLVPYISGTLLSHVKRASERQKSLWKGHITEAIRTLHDHNLVWGDAKPDNIIIEGSTDRAVITDFGGGHSSGWVDGEVQDTKEGDCQALSRIIRYVDDIASDCGQ